MSGVSRSSGRAWLEDEHRGGVNHRLEAAKRHARAVKLDEARERARLRVAGTPTRKSPITMTVRSVRKPAYPELALNGQQIATLIRRIQDPKGGDPGRRLRDHVREGRR